MSKPTIKVRQEDSGKLMSIELGGTIFKSQDKYDLKEFAESILFYVRMWL